MNVKKLNIALSGIFISLILLSCEKEETSADVSRVTYYPNFEMAGPNPILHPLGEAFEDPGVTATEEGEELDVEKSVTGVFRVGSTNEVDENTADHYIITYMAENREGFAGEVTRDVWVAHTGDLVNSIEGLYTSTVVRNGETDPALQEMEYILIWQNQDGTYGISDGIGGYYDIGRNYGRAYAAEGVVITANDIPANDFSFNNPFPVGAFGGNAEITEMTVDPQSNTITFTTVWDLGYTFEVTLNQVQI